MSKVVIHLVNYCSKYMCFNNKISKKLNYSIKDLMVSTEDNRALNVGDGKKIYDVPYFKDGAIINVQSKRPKKKEAVGMNV